MPACNVEPTFGRKFFTSFRHQANRVRPYLTREGHHLIRRCHLEVNGQFDFGHKSPYVIVHNVAPILTQVDGKAVRTGCRNQPSGDNRVGMLTASCISHGGDMIDIHTQTQRLRH